jgi:glycosyltransferase involved in cell wall biosynthesis
VHLATFTDSDFFGGGEKALGTLVAGLDPEIEVTVVGPHAEIVEAVAAARPEASVLIVRDVRDRRDVAGIAAQFRAISRLRPDILHANGNAWSGQYALVAGILTPGVRTLGVNHSLTPHDTSSQVWLNRRKLRRLDAHAAVSHAVARGVEEIGGLRPDSVEVIYNGVPDAPITPLPRPADGPTIGSVGRLSPEKGFDVLLRAAGSLPDVTTVLIGDGPDRRRLEDLAADLGLGEHLIMPGWQPDPLPWLPALDVFVLPSRLEALGLAAIEAMLASRPVVASDVGGVPEVVVEGETGILVPPDDPPALAAALSSLLADEPLRARMGARGREIATRKFDLTTMLRAYESLYRRLHDGERLSRPTNRG